MDGPVEKGMDSKAGDNTHRYRDNGRHTDCAKSPNYKPAGSHSRNGQDSRP